MSETPTESAGTAVAALDVADLTVCYGKKRVLEGVSLRVEHGEAVAVLGHNGAGKSTLLRSVAGLIDTQGGTIAINGKTLTSASPAARVKAGAAFSPQQDFVFGDLTIRQNLALGRFAVRDDDVVASRFAMVYKLFPLLDERGGELARRLSGGQQRMLGIGIALLSNPSILLLDEPSLGLAPTLLHEIMTTLRWLVDEEGLALVLVEQNVRRALDVTDRAYVIQSGRVVAEERSADLADRDDLWKLF